MTAILLLLLLPAPSFPAVDGNLVEYSYGGFADGGAMLGPMLYPPIVKIYQDGRIIFFRDGRYQQGRLSENALASMKKHLANHSLLRETHLIKVKRGGLPGMHGGMAYIRYLDGENEVLIGAMRLPSSGRWHRLVNKLHSLIPKQYSNFVPSSLVATVYRYSVRAKEALISWPFSADIAIAPHADRLDDTITVSDPKAIAFIMGHLSEGFSWLRCLVSEGDSPYAININEVPGWYEPQKIRFLLAALTMELDKDERPR